MMMDLLEKQGFRGVFFVNTYLTAYRQSPDAFAGCGAIPSVGYPLVVYRSLVQAGESRTYPLFALGNAFALCVVLGLFMMTVLLACRMISKSRGGKREGRAAAAEPSIAVC
ncbi:MAG: hypothetical protein R3F54_14565 [Alphaproteobacteria bacterium]